MRLVLEHRAGVSVADGRVRGGRPPVGVGKSRAPVGAASRYRRRHRQGVTSVERDEIKRLKAENRGCVRTTRSCGGDDFLRGGTRPPQPLIMGFIDTMRAEGHAVESICRVLREQGCQIAARTYRAWKHAQPPRRGPDGQ